MSVRDLIVAEIRNAGPIPFSRYMELALYHPEHGFYAHGGAGRRRDFITSPEVGPLFGAVVARALDSWWDELGRPGSLAFVDAGAGPGTLARAVLKAEPRCLGALHYVAVEPSARQRDRHPDGVISTASMPEQLDRSVVFANELLDNLPFDILQFDRDIGWREVLVDVVDGQLRQVAGARPRHQFVPIADAEHGAQIPVQRAAVQWLAQALALPASGRVVVVDYAVPGYPAGAGHQWLRTYTDHERGTDPLLAPGNQDITADVDIETLAGVCVPSAQLTQRDWLRRHGIDELVAEGRDHWAAHAATPDLTAMAMRSRIGEAEALLDPDGLGGFVVLEWAVGAGETPVTR